MNGDPANRMSCPRWFATRRPLIDYRPAYVEAVLFRWIRHGLSCFANLSSQNWLRWLGSVSD